ncbi:hypothetical protein INR49_015200 [Caranx melampygus]|nr:hypothetical protein INR49_015200 [Caranx melampygus]
MSCRHPSREGSVSNDATPTVNPYSARCIQNKFGYSSSTNLTFNDAFVAQDHQVLGDRPPTQTDSEALSSREIPHRRRSRKDFIRRIERNRPKIELKLMVAEAKQGQRTARAMWEESEGVLQFTRIKSKHFVY